MANIARAHENEICIDDCFFIGLLAWHKRQKIKCLFNPQKCFQIEKLKAQIFCPKNIKQPRSDHRAEIEKLRKQKSEAVNNEQYSLAAQIKSKVLSPTFLFSCNLEQNSARQKSVALTYSYMIELKIRSKLWKKHKKLKKPRPHLQPQCRHINSTFAETGAKV